jgi:6-pyruvoyltetrahydropterin/6-carboxytetrahydropterin synthase
MPFRGRIEVAFDAGHRLLDYDGKCASPHGHTFRAEVLVHGDTLDELGLLRDFGDIKRSVKGWIDEHWDHGFLLNSRDAALRAAFAAIPEAKVYVFEGANPSAEAMAREIFRVAECRLGGSLQAVRIWESTTQYAEYLREGAE